MNLWGAKMITIDQLLESVDLDFEPRWVTKDQNGYIELWATKPRIISDGAWGNVGWRTGIPVIKLAEFADKPWQECIYEVPQKTPKKIELLKETTERVMLWKINELVDAVNELKGAK